MNPAKIFDKNNHFFREMKSKKNEKKYHIILNNIKLTTTMKNLNRIMIIGLSQFCDENMKEEKNGMIILRKTVKNFFVIVRSKDIQLYCFLLYR